MPSYKYDDSTNFVTAAQDGRTLHEYPLISAQTPDPYPQTHQRTLYQAASACNPRLAERTNYTNLLTYSSTLANAAHTKTNLTATDNVAAHPRDGAITLGTLIETVTAAEHKLSRSYTFGSAIPHTYSVVTKANGRNWLRLLANDGTSDYAAFFNLATGTSVAVDSAAVVSPSLLNGGFETAGGGGADVFANWTESVAGTSTVTRDTSVKLSGAASCRLNVDASGNFSSIIQNGVLRVGTRYRIDFWAVRGSGVNANINIWDGSTDITSGQALIDFVWTRITREFTATTANFGLSTLTPNGVVWIDDLTVTPINEVTVSLVALPFPAVESYRCAITFTPRAAAGSIALNLSTDGSTISYTGDTTKGIYAASLELKATATAGPVVETLGSTRTASSPDIDADDPFSYLVAESAPTPTGIGDLLRIERTYARIPGQQLRRDYQPFNRPNPSGLKSGSTYAASLDNGASFHLWTSRKSILGYITTPGGTTSNTLPATNITCTDNSGHTAVFAANAASATILTALAALTNLYGFSVYKDPTNTKTIIYYKVYVGNSMTSVTPAASTVDISWVSGTITITAFGTTTTPDTKKLNVPAHGAAIGYSCAVWNGDVLIATGTVAGVSDSDNLSLALSDLNSPEANMTYIAFAPSASLRYSAGSKAVRVKVIRDFFFPGVTMLAAGTVMADLDSIPDVTTYDSPQGWLDRIVAAASSVAISSSDIGQQAGPLAYRDITYVIMDSSALQSLSLT